MRILVCTQPGRGHLRLIQPAVESLCEDHEVLVASSEKFAPAVAALGCELVPVGLNWIESELDETFPEVRSPGSKMSIEADVFAGTTAQAALPDLERHVERLRPDVIVRSAWEFASIVVARRHNIALTSVNPTVFGKRPFNRMFNKPLSVVLGTRCRDAYGLIHGFPSLFTVPRSFVLPYETIPPHARWYRPGLTSDTPGPVASNNDIPRIHVSLGTVVHRPDLYQVVLEALRPLECEVIVAAPAAVTADLVAGPATTFHEYVDHGELLPRCDLFVHHGGSGSVLAALKHQVPAVILPGWADQPRNAEACTQMNIGVGVPVGRQDVANIRAGVEMALANRARLRAQLARLAHEVGAREPVAEALPWVRSFGEDLQ